MNHCSQRRGFYPLQLKWSGVVRPRFLKFFRTGSEIHPLVFLEYQTMPSSIWLFESQVTWLHATQVQNGHPDILGSNDLCFFFFFGSFAGSFYYQKKTSFYEPGGDGVFFKIEMNTAYFFRMKCLDWVWIPSSAWRGLGKDPRSSAGMSTRHLTYNFVTRRICFLQKEHHLCYCHPQQTMYTCIYIYIYVWPPRWHLFTKDPNIHTHTQSHSSFQQTYLYKPHRKGAKHVLGHVLPVWGFGFYEMVPGKAIHGSHVEWHDISS